MQEGGWREGLDWCQGLRLQAVVQVRAGCPRRRTTSLGERQGPEKAGAGPGAGSAHRRPREVKLARELLTYRAYVISDDKSPWKGIKYRVRE